MRAERQLEEHESYELKWAGEKDAEAYKQKMDDEKRKSAEFRHKEGKRHRDVEELIKAEKQQKEHESYELKWAGEKDAEAYKKEMDDKRRQSLEARHKEGKRHREAEAQMRSEKILEEHESYELKWAGEKDAKNYQDAMRAIRRESFALRNKVGRIQRDVMNELLALAKEKETESLVLKWAGENDVKNYLKDDAKKKRESIAFRNIEAKRQRDIDKESHRQDILNQILEEEINAGCKHN